MKRRAATLLFLELMVLGGCRREPADAPAVAPATQVAITAAPATKPADIVPATFVINNQAFVFPAAKLVTAIKDGAVRVTLFSDDPPEALRDGYAGNSFYFRFTFDIDTPAELPGQRYVYSSSFAELGETNSGLFIAGGRQTLRPLEAAVTFEKLDGQIIAHVGGSFRLDDERNADEPSATVRVQAVLEPRVEEAKR